MGNRLVDGDFAHAEAGADDAPDIFPARRGASGQQGEAACAVGRRGDKGVADRLAVDGGILGRDIQRSGGLAVLPKHGVVVQAEGIARFHD